MDLYGVGGDNSYGQLGYEAGRRSKPVHIMNLGSE
jgi:hypothetical protein